MNVTDRCHKYYIFLEPCMPLRELPKDFDGNYYLEVNPDVAAAGVDAALHYLQYGYDEGRSFKRMSALLQAKMGSDVFEFDGLTSVHNHDFMIDPVYQAAYQRGVQAAKGHDYQWYWRIHISLWAASTAIKLPGDFVECGVNRGFLSSAIMQKHDWDTQDRLFYLLDTYQGIDEKYLTKLEIEGGVSERNRTDILTGFYTKNLQEVEANFAEWNNKRIVVGSIPDTLPEIKSDKIAFLHIDLNCTEPEVAAIEYLWDKLVIGAVVVLDDYAFNGFYPQKIGMDNWAAAHKVAIASLPTGQGLIIKT
jgi:hypothetical protein